MTMDKNLADILACFQLDSDPVSCEPYGNGNINRTYLVTAESGRRYILQRLSSEAFKDVPALMENIAGITGYLTCKANKEGTKAHVLAPVKTKVPAENGADTYIEIKDLGDMNGYYRVTPFAENSISLEAPRSDEDFRECAVGFGTFISDLADYPAETLHETIPNFHNTADRYRLFRNALDAAGNDAALSDRLKEAAPEIEFALARQDEAGTLQSMREDGLLPVRVTHNDTKLNNVLLDADTGKTLYVIDLDTVMPGLSLYDYGDCVRFGASTAAEDEKDLSKVSFDLHMYEVFTIAFAKACRGLTEKEIEMMPMGVKTITLELGVRFLTDFLESDRYFTTRYPGHNLDRCRTQFKLVADMESKWDEMLRIAGEAVKEIK